MKPFELEPMLENQDNHLAAAANGAEMTSSTSSEPSAVWRPRNRRPKFRAENRRPLSPGPPAQRRFTRLTNRGVPDGEATPSPKSKLRTKMTKKQRERTQAFLETTTIHGLSEIYQGRGHCQKCFFVAAFLITNGLFVYECYQVINQYIQRPVATSYFVMEAEKLNLPDITLCPFNRFDKMFLQRTFFLMSPSYDFVDFNAEMKYFHRNGAKFERELDGVLERMNMSFVEFVLAASTKCSDIIQKCVINYMALNCCDTAQPVISSMGQCFRLKGIEQIGSGYGMISMTVMVRLPLERHTPTVTMPMNDGVMVKLTEPGKGFEYDAIFVPTGVHALLQLRATHMKFMNDPPRYSCLDNASKDYAPFMCYQRCLLKPMEDTCNCRYIGLEESLDVNATSAPPNETAPVCRPLQLLKCGYRALASKGKSEPNFMASCKARCKARCMGQMCGEYWQYQATVSYAKFPSRTLGFPHFSPTSLEGNMTAAEQKDLKEEHYQRILKSEMLIELFYEKLEYTRIQHFPSMTPDTFIANIGGQMGLWMGGSILSIVHLVVFLLTFFKEDFRECHRRKEKERALTPMHDVPCGGENLEPRRTSCPHCNCPLCRPLQQTSADAASSLSSVLATTNSRLVLVEHSPATASQGAVCLSPISLPPDCASSYTELL